MDKMKTTMSADGVDIVPYGHHYRCFPQMIGSAVNQSVFMYLMDEYSHRLKDGRSLSFNISVNEIKKDRNLSWKAVSNSLQSFQNMKLITLDGNLCTLDGDRFVSLIKVFNQTGGEEKRKRFSEFLEKGDYDSLKKFGFQLEYNSKNELLSLKGGGFSQMLEGSNKSERVLINVTSEFSQKLEPSHKSENLTPINTTQSSNKSENLLTFLRSNSLEIVQIISENCDKVHLLEYFQENYTHFLSEEEITQMVDVIFDKNELKSVDFGVEWFSLFLQLLLTFLRSGFSLFLEEVLTNVRTVNKGININKINKKNVLLEKNQNNTFESSSILENSGDNISQEDEFIDLNFLQEVSPERKRKFSSSSSYQELKNKSRLPYFPVEEIENIIADLSICLDRPDKIFINQVWDCLLPFFVSEKEGENEEMVESQLDPEGMFIYADRIIQDIITPAFEETQNIISRGKLNISGTDFPVTASELTPNEAQQIIDFKLTVKDGERVYIVSKKSFRNIYAKPIPATLKKDVREGREEDKAYMQEIILIGDDDDRYKELTPIELVIYNFLSDYFNINEDGSIESPKQKFVNRVSLSRFYLSVKEKGLDESDFLSVLFKTSPDKQTGSLTLKPRMFCSDKIKEWNLINGYKSSIFVQDEEMIEGEAKSQAGVK